jgi:hypothetical protein
MEHNWIAALFLEDGTPTDDYYCTKCNIVRYPTQFADGVGYAAHDKFIGYIEPDCAEEQIRNFIE